MGVVALAITPIFFAACDSDTRAIESGGGEKFIALSLNSIVMPAFAWSRVRCVLLGKRHVVILIPLLTETIFSG